MNDSGIGPYHVHKIEYTKKHFIPLDETNDKRIYSILSDGTVKVNQSFLSTDKKEKREYCVSTDETEKLVSELMMLVKSPEIDSMPIVLDDDTSATIKVDYEYGHYEVFTRGLCVNGTCAGSIIEDFLRRNGIR